MKKVYMGYSQENITTERPVQLIGYDARLDNTSKGILHQLITQVLILKTLKEKYCLITIDSLGFTVELTDKLRKKVSEILLTAPEKIMVCFSHTHSAPNAGIDEAYYNFVCSQIINAVKNADESMCLIKASWGISENNIGVNRRGNEYSFDRRIGILKFTDLEQNNLKVLLLRVTAHANILMPDNYLISSDYFGITRELIENKYGCKVILIQGASGDVKPKYRQENADFLEIHPFEASIQKISKTKQRKYYEQSLYSLNKTAELIYQSVENVINKLIPQPIHTISMFSVKCPFFSDVPNLNQALHIYKEAKENSGIDGTDWLNEVKKLHKENIKKQYYDIEIQYFVINDGCICGVPNEIMSDIAINIQKESNNNFLFFNGYTNGCTCYLSTSEEYDRGGYEIFWSNLLYYKYHKRVMAFNRNTAEILQDNVIYNFKKFTKK